MTKEEALKLIDQILKDMADADFQNAVAVGGRTAVSQCDEQRERLIKARRHLTE